MIRGRWQPTHPGSAVVTLRLDGRDFDLAVMDARALCRSGLEATEVALSHPLIGEDGQPHGHMGADLDDWLGG